MEDRDIDIYIYKVYIAGFNNLNTYLARKTKHRSKTKHLAKQ